MSNYEYKTVALSRSIAARKRRKQSEADLVAEQLGTVLNEEAVDGWEYLRAETLTTPARDGWFKKGQAGAYVVLIFQRARSVAWRRDEAPAEIARNAQRAAETQQTAPPPPQQEPQISATPAAPQVQNTPDIRIASTSPRAAPDEPTIGDGSVTPMHPRPPLGSATD